MNRRVVAIWFPHLITDRMLRRRPELKDLPFVLVSTERGRRVVKAVNRVAQMQGVYTEMVLADCKALVPDLQVFEFDPEQVQKLLLAMAGWCIRYTPFVSIDAPNGILLDASGCVHLWKGEKEYLLDIKNRFEKLGYHIQIAMADTPGTAWALSRFGKGTEIVNSGDEANALSKLPSAALRIEALVLDRLEKLGLKTIDSFMNMPRNALRRRFGPELLSRLNQATGEEMEILDPIRPIPPYLETLPSLEPIRSAPGIEIALKTLLETLCLRLNRESKGLRKCEFRGYRIDGGVQKIEIGTGRPSRNTTHLFKLFESKIQNLEPGLGIELFAIEAVVVEELLGDQDSMWTSTSADDSAIAELLDRVAGKIGAGSIHRYLPAEHYLPERSVKETSLLTEKPSTEWRTDLPRPLHLLSKPEPIEVSVPIPDYPPLLFIYKGQRHMVMRADGPERIEQEWWIQSGLYRDYYGVEDQEGARYWIFRSGDYGKGTPKWFLHGFFA